MGPRAAEALAAARALPAALTVTTHVLWEQEQAWGACGDPDAAILVGSLLQRVAVCGQEARRPLLPLPGTSLGEWVMPVQGQASSSCSTERQAEERKPRDVFLSFR